MTSPIQVAGRGTVSAYGMGLKALVEGVISGRRAVRARERTLCFEAPTEVAAEFPSACFEELQRRNVAGDPSTGELSFAAAMAAAREALVEAGIDPSDSAQLGGIGFVLATTKADLSGVVGDGEGLGLPARFARRLADALGFGGPVSSVSTACASGVTAIAMAVRRISLGEVERVMVVGVDTINEFIMAGFGSMRILDPVPCRPFDGSRAGISLGDGAGAILLSADPTETVGASITGHGGANDAVSVTGCHREGLGVSLATRRALAHAGCDPEAVDLVHLHGTGTIASDFSEAVGLGVTFDGDTPPALGTKGLTGHTLGAAGVLETIITLACLEQKRVPANAGLSQTNVDPRLSLVASPETLRAGRCALKVSGGFGGIQQAIVIQR